MIRKMYHTQESRDYQLSSPVLCTRDDAWLGDAYYYWLNQEDADHWGNNSKKATGYFEVYESEIDLENVLNTVFNEEHYDFWLETIEKIAKTIMRKTKMRPTLKELNNYILQRGNWQDVSGILFQDLPATDYYSLVQPLIYGQKRVYFAYKKRIQLAVYKTEIILNFALLYKKECF